VEITLIKEGENGKPAEQIEISSARDASIKAQKAANLPTYPKKRYHGTPGYPF
jgi:hypothetical protein